MNERDASLFDGHIEPKLVQEFRRWDAANPDIWPLFKRFAIEAIRSGRKQFGASAIWERIRWELAVETEGDDFKFNNAWRAFYARKFMQHYPMYDGFFHTRRSEADEALSPL